VKPVSIGQAFVEQASARDAQPPPPLPSQGIELETQHTPPPIGAPASPALVPASHWRAQAGASSTSTLHRFTFVMIER